MFDKKIVFKSHEFILEQKQDYPKPAFLELPSWFKHLKETTPEAPSTIRMCKPFFDSLSAGYFIKAFKDITIETFDNLGQEDFRDTTDTLPEHIAMKYGMQQNIGTNNYHHKMQLGKECPFHKHNNDRSYFKYVNPWYIFTPPGYSCLFVPILNEINKDFYTLSGIVETDTYHEVNFPMILFNKNTTIKKGTPIVQVIPFKRENWKLEIGELNKKDIKYLDKKQFSRSLIKKYFYTLNSWVRKKWM